MGCIVQAITGNDGRSYTRQQLDACVRNGLRIQGYVWSFPNASLSSINGRLSMFDGFPIERLWVDVEQAGLHQSDVDRDLAACDRYMGTWTRVGIYTGRWFWAQQGWLSLTRWADRALWDSNYTGIADVGSGFIPYGGWQWPKITQYRGTSSVGVVNQVDLNVSAL